MPARVLPNPLFDRPGSRGGGSSAAESSSPLGTREHTPLSVHALSAENGGRSMADLLPSQRGIEAVVVPPHTPYGSSPAVVGKRPGQVIVDPHIPGASCTVDVGSLSAAQLNAARAEANTYHADPSMQIAETMHIIAEQQRTGRVPAVAPASATPVAAATETAPIKQAQTRPVDNSVRRVAPASWGTPAAAPVAPGALWEAGTGMPAAPPVHAASQVVTALPVVDEVLPPGMAITFETNDPAFGIATRKALYHHIIRSDAALILAYDTRYAGEMFIPLNAEQQFVALVSGSEVVLQLIGTGIHFEFLHYCLCILLIAGERPLQPPQPEAQPWTSGETYSQG